MRSKSNKLVVHIQLMYIQVMYGFCLLAAFSPPREPPCSLGREMGRTVGATPENHAEWTRHPTCRTRHTADRWRYMCWCNFPSSVLFRFALGLVLTPGSPPPSLSSFATLFRFRLEV
jgi:hypothetical protein